MKNDDNKTTGHHQIIDHYFDGLSFVGEGKMDRIVTHSGMEWIESNVNFNERHNVSFQSAAAMVELNFCFQGETEIAVSGSSHQLQPGYCTLQFMKDFDVSFDYRSQSTLSTMAIGIPLSLFDNYMGEARGNRKSSFEQIIGKHSFRKFQTKIEADALHIINQLTQYPHQSVMRNMYIEGKMLELLALYFDHLLFEEEHVPRKSVISRSDRDKIYKAEEILLMNMEHPPSLIELAHQCGLNDYKLKIGFKEQFGKSVFAYLRHKRMEKAWKLLHFENLSVSQVAQQVGYSNFSHFTELFREFYSCNPSDVVRERSRKIFH